MAVKIKSDRARIAQRVQNGTQAARAAVVEHILATCIELELVPVAEGALRDSAQTASIPKAGKAIWDTDYAKRQYYTHATKRMWAQRAVDSQRKTLDLIAQKAMEKGMGE